MLASKTRAKSSAKKSGWLRSLICLSCLLILLSSGCKGWEADTAFKPRPKVILASTPGYDSDGNLLVSTEIENTYRFPDIHAGVTYDVEFGRVRPVLEVELLEFKAPYVRWNQVGILVGEDLIGAHLSHRWTSIYEVSTGVWVGYDTNEHDTTFGFAAFIMKF